MRKLKSLTLAAVVLIAVLSSCVSKRLKICRTCAIKDSIVFKEVIKLKDTTVYITLHGPTQYLENPCAHLCDSFGNLKPFEVKKKANGIVGTIKSVGNSLAFDCDADSLEAIIRDLEERTIVKSNTITRLAACDKEHRSSFDGFCRWWLYISAGICLLLLGWRILKSYFKILFLNK